MNFIVPAQMWTLHVCQDQPDFNVFCLFVCLFFEYIFNCDLSVTFDLSDEEVNVYMPKINTVYYVTFETAIRKIL